MKKFFAIILLCAFSVSFITPGNSFAADSIWAGLGDPDSWSDSDNWEALNPLANGNTLIFTTSNNLDNTNNISGSDYAGITFDGSAGSFTLMGAELTQLSGAITNNSGTNQSIAFDIELLAGGGAINAGASGTLTLGNIDNGSQTLSIAGAGNTTIGGVISNDGGLTKDGAGTLNLGDANTYTGVTTLTNGIVNAAYINDGGEAGSIGQATSDAANLVFNGGTLEYSGGGETTDRNFTINDGKTAVIQVDANTLTMTGYASAASTGGFTSNGAGTLYLSGTTLTDPAYINNYSGVTTIATGTLKIDDAAAIGDASATNTITLNGGTLETTATTTLVSNRAITLSGTGGTLKSAAGILTIAGAITTAGALLTVQGAGSTTINGAISGAGGVTVATGAGSGLLMGARNSYTGATTVTSGTITAGIDQSGTDGAFGRSSAVTLNNTDNGGIGLYNSGTDLSYNNTIGSLSGATTTSQVYLGSATLTTGGNNSSTTYAGYIWDDPASSTGKLIKKGSGTMTLTYANAYGGGTTIDVGTIKAGVDQALGTGAISVTATNAAFDLNGITYSTASALSLIGTGVSSAGALTNSSATAATYGGVVTIGATGASIGGTGNITLSQGLGTSANDLTKVGAGTLILNGASSRTGGTTISAGTIQVGNATALGTGSLTNADGGTLTLGTTQLNIGSGVYAQDSGSTLNVTANSSTNYGKIVSTSAATGVAGANTVNLTVGGFVANNTTLKIVDTNGAGATFTLPTLNVSGDSRTAYSGALSGGNYVITASRTANGFAATATNPNTAAVGNVLDNMTNPTAGMTTALTNLNNASTTAANNALNTLAAPVNNGVTQTTQQTSTTMMNITSEHITSVLSTRTNGTGTSTPPAPPAVVTRSASSQASSLIAGRISQAVSGAVGNISGASTSTSTVTTTPAAITTSATPTVAAPTAQTPGLATTQVNALSTAQIAALTTSQVPALSTAQVAGLSTAQLKALSTAQIAGLSTAQIAALTTSQVPALSTAQVASLSTSQLTALSTAQIAGLSTAQLKALSTAQVAGLSTTVTPPTTTTQSQAATTGTGTQTTTTTSTTAAANPQAAIDAAAATYVKTVNAAKAEKEALMRKAGEEFSANPGAPEASKKYTDAIQAADAKYKATVKAATDDATAAGVDSETASKAFSDYTKAADAKAATGTATQDTTTTATQTTTTGTETKDTKTTDTTATKKAAETSAITPKKGTSPYAPPPRRPPAKKQSALNTSTATIAKANAPQNSGTSCGDGDADHLASLKGVSIWAQGLGDYSHQAPRATSNGYNSTTWGVMGGVDIPLCIESIIMGLGTGYGQSFVRSKDNSGRTDMSNIPANIYFGYSDKDHPFYVSTVFSFNYSSYTGYRQVTDTVNVYTAKAEYNGQQYSGYLESGYSFFHKNISLTPLASFMYMHSYTGSYTETDASALSLHVDSMNSDVAQTGLGAKLNCPFNNKYGSFTPELRFKWLYDWVGDQTASTSSFIGGGSSFNTQGYAPAQSSYDFGARLTYVTKYNVTFDISYDLMLKEDFYEHTGVVNVKYTF